MPQQQAHDLKDVDLQSHPAFVAWSAACPAPRPPINIAVLQEKSRAGVYRLDGAAPDGGAVIAKRSKHVKNIVEWRIYTRILPDLPVKSVRCYALLEPEGDQNSWIFLSVADGNASYSPFNPRHRILAAQWLALLHTTAAEAAANIELPDRSDANYLGLLHAARQTIIETIENPVLNGWQRDVLTRCIEVCDRAESHWDQVERVCGHAPMTLIHGDFAAKNMRVCNGVGGEPEALIPYDWGQAGYGVPAADLAQPLMPNERYWVSPDLDTYRQAVCGQWADLKISDLRALGHVGRIFRAVVCLHGDVKSLRTPWVEHVIYKIDAYRQQMDDALRAGGWLGRGGRRTPGGRQRQSPDDESLRSGLERMLGAGALVITKREPNLYASTFMSEFVTARFPAEDREVELFCKYVDDNIDTCYGHRGTAAYEAQVYRDVLGAMKCDIPKFFGTIRDAASGQTWLALERVAGCERLSEVAHPAKPFAQAAKWIGSFHAAAGIAAIAPDQFPLMIRHDEHYYMAWVHRTLDFSRQLRDRYPWIVMLCRRAQLLLAPMLNDEPTLIHGEYYPHNLLVRNGDGGVVPIDWQSAALASGAIDLAALTEKWPAEIAAAGEQAYAAARWIHGAPANFPQVLHAARLHLHFRWLGDRPRWTQAQRSEWRFEELRRAGEQSGLI